MKLIIILSTFLTLSGCSTSPTGQVLATTSEDTLQIKYPKNKLKIGDRVNIIEVTEDIHTETPEPIRKQIIGQGIVSSVIKDNIYEVKIQSVMNIPTRSSVEKARQ